MCLGEVGNRQYTSSTISTLVIGNRKQNSKDSGSANLNYHWFQENYTG